MSEPVPGVQCRSSCSNKLVAQYVPMAITARRLRRLWVCLVGVLSFVFRKSCGVW